MPGMVLGGRYQVQDKIGTGGMATVFRGLDEVLGRTVAIKTMLPQYAADPSFAARFKQEAQAAAALQSPYIVSVYDWGKDADTYYIVMEFLRGTDLKSGIRKHGALDCKKVAQIGSQIAQALSVAHKHDIIHRDIKPQNIMVQPDGNIKVMDFGIARAKNSHLTQDNSVLGTAHYVSPEQTQGKPLGPTTDIYSLGIVMYEAATGQVPFQGDDAISVALKQVNEQPKPPSQLNPNVDPALEAIILKCMQKNPADRFQTADELYRTLRDYLSGRVQAVNSATAMLPAQVTNKLEHGEGMVPAKNGTASLPRVERTNRYRPQSATEQAAEQDAERERKHRRNVILGVVAAIVVVGAIAAAVIMSMGSAVAKKDVPYLLNMTEQQAREAIREAGFEVGEVKEGFSSSVDEGLVYEQTPTANTKADEGSKINLRISKGEEPAADTEVPDLTNLTPEKAEETLKKYNLIGRRGDDQQSSEVEAGKVCGQDTKPGDTAKVGDTVTYHVSTGAGTVAVPDILGDTRDGADERLNAVGLHPNFTQEYSSTVPEGCVISADPEPGTQVAPDSNVNVVISKGAEPEQTTSDVQIPNVVSWTYAAARETLADVWGFDVQLAPGCPADGIVTKQSLTGSAPKGATIVLTTEASGTAGGGSGTGSGSGGGSGTGEGTGGQTGSGSGGGTETTPSR
ncbi:Stk1 family PASTA domain-containing Ser/Thr kinase [Olsenella sp. An290]|uniref:Stk1 family PASTA domain-containing Ser/Thr kinase n=1 Tax=Olsenella sp. An290 TaxID=1965625 RepID=UPI000B381611|nr:Stk1 family PASTA domain-containing Ser/Thr kinase [Olsenella sp. An290]OUO33492.1 serine/threonine protein kinase [Olsenella sp. An290]